MAPENPDPQREDVVKLARTSAESELEPSRRRPRRQEWWSPQLDENSLHRLMERRDLPGVLFFAAWLTGVCVTTWALYWTWQSWWVVPVLLGHGAVLSFSYAASHECAHRTAFKSDWLNEVVFYITSFVFGEEPMVRRYSHGRHHAYTWFPGLDSQMPYRNPVSLRTYIRETLALIGLKDLFVQTLRLAMGKVPTDAGTRTVPASKIAQMRWGARAFLAGYVCIAVSAALLQSWFPIVAFFGGRTVGGCVVQLYINSQHMCMDESVADHRYSTRSLRCTVLMRVLYWNMNFHIEHHLHPGVPFHALPKLERLIAKQLPIPCRGALAANLEILRTIRQQTYDPSRSSRPRFSTE